MLLGYLEHWPQQGPGKCIHEQRHGVARGSKRVMDTVWARSGLSPLFEARCWTVDSDSDERKVDCEVIPSPVATQTTDNDLLGVGNG